MTSTVDLLPAFVEKARRLYTLPAVALEVLKLTEQPQVDIRALKQCIENDPALTTKVLRVVNSSLFGLSREVSDLNQALALLGTKPLKLLVLGFSLSESFCANMTGRAIQRYWRYALTKAVAARCIAETLYHTSGDEPFIAALLHDLGILVLLQELGEPYANFFDRVVASRADLSARETEFLGFNHHELTGKLLQEWGMPPWLVATCDGGGDSSDEPARPSQMSNTLCMADLLAELLIHDRHEVLDELLDDRCGGPALSPTQLTALVYDLQAKVDQLADVLSVELPAGEDYAGVLAKSHRRLSEVSEDVAGDLLRGADTMSPPADSGKWTEAEELTAALDRFIDSSRGPQSRAQATRQVVLSEGSQRPSRLRSRHEGAIASNRANSEIEQKLLARLLPAVANCRQARLPVGLALVELDNFDDVAHELGPLEAEKRVERLAEACAALELDCLECIQLTQARFAIVLPSCDRTQAVQLGNQLVHGARDLLVGGTAGADFPSTLSVGVATVSLPSKNFPASELLESARRCLGGAQLSGGNTVKSIGIY